MIGAGRKAVARVVLTGRVDPVAKVTGHSRLLVAREKMGHCLRRVTIEITQHASSQRRGPATLAAPRPLRSEVKTTPDPSQEGNCQ